MNRQAAILICAAHLLLPSIVRADNNLVTTLLNIDQAEGRAYRFTNPRDGWVFIAIAGEESMRWMKSGDHEVKPTPGKPLVVRAIPEIVYSEIGYRPNPILASFPRYEVPYLEKIGVFRNVNVVLELNPEPYFDVAKWKASGRQTRVRVGSGDAKPQDAYDFWANHRGMRDPYDGIQISEYDGWKNSPHLPDYAHLAEAVRRIAQDSRFAGKRIVPYTVAMYDSPESLAFLKELFRAGHPQACERYLAEEPSLESAKREINRLGTVADEYRKHLPGSERNSIVALGYMSAPPETLDNCPNANYLVFMDMQMNALATASAFKNLYGVEWYHSAYADEEALRWSVRLIRHYCIEGRAEPLSKDPYLLPHLSNGDFADGPADAPAAWTLERAEPDSMGVRSHDGISYLQSRYPQVEQGRTFLWTRRSAARPNIFRQTIRSLEPGRAYSLKMMLCDYADLANSRDSRQEHKPLIRIAGVEMMPAASFREVFPSGLAGHGYEKFDRTNNLWITYHRLVFRAQAATAELTVSDWESPDKPGGAAGQELMFNYISVQPYLEP